MGSHARSHPSRDPSEPLSFSEFYNIIDGKREETTETRHGVNPSTLEANPDVPVSTRQDVDRAVHAARRAFASWSKVPIKERRAAVLAFSEALASHMEEFAKMLTKEQGTPFVLAKAEMQTSATRLQKQANIGMPEITVEEDDRTVITRYSPLGVVCGIVPWSFPFNIACGKIAPALVAGNAFIMKPSPLTPYCGLKMCELAQSFFPPGVLQCLSGDDELGTWLTEHPGIDKVSFTGSTVTGKKVMESCSRTLKRVDLELGGNDPAIIYPDVDVAAVAPAIARIALYSSGQVCLALKRVYVHADIYAPFRDALLAAISAFAVGDGFSEGVFLGPVQNRAQYDRVKEMIADAESQDVSLLSPEQGAVPDKGLFIVPTVVVNPPDDSRVVVEEPLGPVFPLLSWTDEDDVIARANNPKFGLGASVWTKDVRHAAAVARKLDAGSVWINNHMDSSPDVAAGGHKESGIGAEGGLAGMLSYCNYQVTYVPKA